MSKLKDILLIAILVTLALADAKTPKSLNGCDCGKAVRPYFEGQDNRKEISDLYNDYDEEENNYSEESYNFQNYYDFDEDDYYSQDPQSEKVKEEKDEKKIEKEKSKDKSKEKKRKKPKKTPQPESQKTKPVKAKQSKKIERNVTTTTESSIRDEDTRIVNGYEPENRPWLVHISILGGMCGGAIISRKHVLTAAHCFCRAGMAPCEEVLTDGKPTHQPVYNVTAAVAVYAGINNLRFREVDPRNKYIPRTVE